MTTAVSCNDWGWSGFNKYLCQACMFHFVRSTLCSYFTADYCSIVSFSIFLAYERMNERSLYFCAKFLCQWIKSLQSSRLCVRNFKTTRIYNYQIRGSFHK